MSETQPEQPEDFVPDDDFDDEHSKDATGGPGGVVNYPEDTWPEGFDPNAATASPKVVDGNVEEKA